MSKNRGQRTYFNARLTAIVSTSLVLFLLGIIAFLGFGAQSLSTYIKENISFSIILGDDIPDHEIDGMKKKLSHAPYVKEVVYISKEQALEELTKELGENPEKFLGFNPLMAEFQVRLKENYANLDSINMIQDQLKKNNSIRDMIYQREMVDLVNQNIHRATYVLLSVAALLMIISFLLINNTIRLSIHAKRFTIHTMRLVGATNGFIRRPFIVDNIINGVIAAAVSCGALYGLLIYIDNQVPGLFTVVTGQQIALCGILVLTLGVLLSWISSVIAMNYYLGMRYEKMHLV